jgi:hypothetical protein
MTSKIKQGFKKKLIVLATADLHFNKTISVSIKQGRKYSQILSSIREDGLSEPPVVFFCTESRKYLIMDGHLRIMALRELGVEHVKCLESVDDESYTYNKFTNRLSVIQEHKMLIKALNEGVPEEKLAASLNLDLKTIREKKNMLDGICPEAVDLLKDKIMSISVFQILKKMKPLRQIKVAMLMNDQNRYGQSYARLLLTGTPDDLLVDGGAKKKKLSPAVVERRMRLEEENIVLNDDIHALNESFGRDMLHLNLLLSYLKRWMGNEKVVNYLQKHHPEVHEKLSEITAMDFFTMKSASSGLG